MNGLINQYLSGFALVILVTLSFKGQSAFEASNNQDASSHNNEQAVFEMRTYTSFDGKLSALNARFQNHTLALFKKHNIHSIGYWVPTDKPNTLVYIVSHKSRVAAAASWKSFIADPQWKAAYADSIKDGRLVSNIDSIFMTATEYSAIN